MSDTQTPLPPPQGAFVGLNSAQWKSAITVIMASALGPVIKGALDKIGLPLDAGGAADLLVTYGPTVVGVAVAVLRRAHNAVMADVAKILAARGQNVASATVQAAAMVPADVTPAALAKKG